LPRILENHSLQNLGESYQTQGQDFEQVKRNSIIMVEETQPYLHRLLAAAESQSTSISETSLSGDEGTSFLEDKEKASEETENDADVEKGNIRSTQPMEKKTSSLHFLGWTIINTLATIGIVSGQPTLWRIH
jgi:hypothetical protein